MPPTSFHRLSGAVVIALDVTVLRAGWVPPAELIAHLSHPRRWVDAVGTDGAALELARAGLWLAALWLAVAVIAVLTSALPGTLGRIAGGVVGRAVPAILRRSIVAALGASVVLVPVAAGAGTTADHRGASPVSTAAAAAVETSASARRAAAAGTSAAAESPRPSATRATPLSGGGGPWPTSAPTSAPTSPPASTTPTAPTSGSASPAPANPVPWPHSVPPRSAPEPSSSDVVVGTGDCLWAIAAHRLGPTASAHQIAAETRRWYQANATTIGADPALIHPGQHLHQPTEKGR